MNIDNKEIEVRFLEINQEQLIKQLALLGAGDYGEEILEEIIFYDKDYLWRDKENKLVRLRKNGKSIVLSFKHYQQDNIDGVEEIEFTIGDKDKAISFLERLGLVAYRYQEKKRHSFKLDDVVIDIDTWPRIPSYVELEGNSEFSLKKVAEKLDLDWADAVFQNARTIIEKRYNIPVGSMKWFTFNKFE